MQSEYMMAAHFSGIDKVLNYNLPGELSNPCLAVDLAMLGVGSMNECHDALMKHGISTKDGLSTMPSEVTELYINGNSVRFNPPNLYFDLDRLQADNQAQFNRGGATIIPIKLYEDPTNDMLHLILLGGQYDENNQVTHIAVGDSLQDGIQLMTPENLSRRLTSTLENLGALFSHHVEVDYGI